MTFAIFKLQYRHGCKSTFGKSSKRTPIQSVMTKITIAERAPATCSDREKCMDVSCERQGGKPAEELAET